MNFCWVTLHVRDFEKSLEFYHETLGLPICSRHDAGGLKIAMLGEEGRTQVELLYNENDAQPRTSGGISIGFAVSSLGKTTEYLSGKNIPVLRGPIAPNPHIRFLFIEDPDGYEVQLVENL